MSALPPLLAGHPRPRPNLPQRLRQPNNNGHLRCDNRPPPRRHPSPHNPHGSNASQAPPRPRIPLLPIPDIGRHNLLPRPLRNRTQRLPTIPLPPRLLRNPRRNSSLKRPSNRLLRPRPRRQETKIQTRPRLSLRHRKHG